MSIPDWIAAATGALLVGSTSLAGGMPAHTVRLHVNDAVDLPAANVRCVSRQRDALTCGGKNSAIFVRITPRWVRVFEATGPNAIFKLKYKIER